MSYHYPNNNPSPRQKHLQWCKDRALAIAKDGDLTGAVSSMISDLNKSNETKVDPLLYMLGMMELQNGRAAVERWIEGFN